MISSLTKMATGSKLNLPTIARSDKNQRCSTGTSLVVVVGSRRCTEFLEEIMEKKPLSEHPDLKRSEKRYARYRVNDALKTGVLERSPVCQWCGDRCQTEAHHYKGYGFMHILDVQWLCRTCHNMMHSRKFVENMIDTFKNHSPEGYNKMPYIPEIYGDQNRKGKK